MTSGKDSNVIDFGESDHVGSRQAPQIGFVFCLNTLRVPSETVFDEAVEDIAAVRKIGDQHISLFILPSCINLPGSADLLRDFLRLHKNAYKLTHDSNVKVVGVSGVSGVSGDGDEVNDSLIQDAKHHALRYLRSGLGIHYAVFMKRDSLERLTNEAVAKVLSAAEKGNFMTVQGCVVLEI
ncbi:MAG: hypothetical protein AAB552_03770 [Patescibacteria group bacterium]